MPVNWEAQKRKRRYQQAAGREETRRGPVLPGVQTRAAQAVQTSRPAGQERAGMQSHAGTQAVPVAARSYEQMSVFERAKELLKGGYPFKKRP